MFRREGRERRVAQWCRCLFDPRVRLVYHWHGARGLEALARRGHVQRFGLSGLFSEAGRDYYRADGAVGGRASTRFEGADRAARAAGAVRAPARLDAFSGRARGPLSRRCNVLCCPRDA